MFLHHPLELAILHDLCFVVFLQDLNEKVEIVVV